VILIIHLRDHIGILILLCIEYGIYLVNEVESLERYVGFWVFIYLTLLLFHFFNVKTKGYIAGGEAHNLSFLAIDKIDKLFDRPKRQPIGFIPTLIYSIVILLIINILIYIVLFVV